MKRIITNLLPRRYLISAVILLVGLGSAILIYLKADNASDGDLLSDFDNSKKYMHNLELYGGKANVLAYELRNWFVGLWHGKSLAVMVACISIFIAFGYLFFASDPESDSRGKTKRG
jgi:hypothetical protein